MRPPDFEALGVVRPPRSFRPGAFCPPCPSSWQLWSIVMFIVVIEMMMMMMMMMMIMVMAMMVIVSPGMAHLGCKKRRDNDDDDNDGDNFIQFTILSML